MNGFLDRGDCEFAYIADVNAKQFAFADAFAKRQGGRRPKCVQDFRKAGATGGLHVTTAGSLAAGTGVGRMRWLMQAVARHCRYDQ